MKLIELEFELEFELDVEVGWALAEFSCSVAPGNASSVSKMSRVSLEKGPTEPDGRVGLSRIAATLLILWFLLCWLSSGETCRCDSEV